MAYDTSKLTTLGQLQLTAQAAKDYTDSKVANVDVTNEALGLALNGDTSTSYDGSEEVALAWYAPTTAGSEGYELISSGSGAPVWKAPSYGVCSTAAATAAKTVDVENFILAPGARIAVTFTFATSVASPTLNVNGTGAIPICWYGGAVPTASNSDYRNTWYDGETLEMVYDGSNYIVLGRSENILSAFNSNNYVGIDEVTDDLRGSINSLTISGTTITYTKNDGSTGTIETQDTTYTHPTYSTTANTSTATPKFGDTVTVIDTVTTDNGHVTAKNTKTVTIPNTEASTTAAGLMSADDKTVLDNAADELDVINAAITASGYLDGIGDAESDEGIATLLADLVGMFGATYTDDYAGMAEIVAALTQLSLDVSDLYSAGYGNTSIATDDEAEEMLTEIFG